MFRGSCKKVKVKMFRGVKIVTVFLFVFVRYVLSVNTNSSCEYRRITDSKTHLPLYIGDCSGLSLTKFPNVWQKINILDLAENKLQKLDTSETNLNSATLKILILSYNEISEISSDFFNQSTKLTELDLSYNNIKILQSKIFQNLEKLSKLDLSFNNLMSLPSEIFNHQIYLKHLDLSYNPLGNFLTSNTTMRNVLQLNKDITDLKLDGLNLTHIGSKYFYEFKKLISLSLADNAFENIPNIPYSTEILDLSGNRFTSITASYLNYPSLKQLSLNRMRTLTAIHHYAFYNLYSLEKLYINDCANLKIFSELSFDFAPKNYRLHPKVLSLSGNGLQTLNETYEYFFRQMFHIDLRYNPWRCDCDIFWLKDFKMQLYKSHEMR